MDIIKIKLCVVFVLGVFSLNAAVASIYISQASLFLSVSGSSYQDDQLGDYDPIFAPQVNTFESNGFGVVFGSNLTNNLGAMTWSITNNTGDRISSSQLMGFLDADLGDNEFWNEHGATFGSVGSQYDSWEIDEPGYDYKDGAYIGDIYDHLLGSGPLDNNGSFPTGSGDSFPAASDILNDVSLALGFNVSNWLAGETVIVTFLIADAMNDLAGLAQFDGIGDDGQAIYFSGSIENIGVIPIPGSAGLMLSALVLMTVARYRKKISITT